MERMIVIIGGFQSAWPLYLPGARHLEVATGHRAVAVPIMPWHWWTAARQEDATSLLEKLDGTVNWAARRYGVARCTLVGHSAGGLLARLYVADGAVWGRRYRHADRVDAILTLGSPHCEHRGTGTGWYLGDAANQLAPGAPHCDTIAYRAIGGRAVQGRIAGSPREQFAYRTYRALGGHGDVWGDGTVPVPCTRLNGAENVTLEGVGHSLRYGHWYLSSPHVIRRWWA